MSLEFEFWVLALGSGLTVQRFMIYDLGVASRVLSSRDVSLTYNCKLSSFVSILPYIIDTSV
jgi:hypothetical protein